MAGDRDYNCTIVSLHPFLINEKKPGIYPGNFRIDGSDGKKPNILLVGESHYYKYVGEGRGDLGKERDQILIRVPSTEIAESVVQDFLESQLGREAGEVEPGIFWVQGSYDLARIEKELVKELEIARRKQKQWFLALVKMADDDWERTRQHKAISNLQRFAARFLGLDRPWLIEIKADKLSTIKCVACQEIISSAAIICPNCSCIIDEEKFKKLKFAKAGAA